ncbi:hypothetical protein PENTCL1PPCAC_24895, partial [Pristionchus entomophagus]
LAHLRDWHTQSSEAVRTVALMDSFSSQSDPVGGRVDNYVSARSTIVIDLVIMSPVLIAF